MTLTMHPGKSLNNHAKRNIPKTAGLFGGGGGVGRV